MSIKDSGLGRHKAACCRKGEAPRQESELEPVTHFRDAPLHRQEHIFDRSVTVLENEGAGDFALRDAGKTNPRGLRYAVAMRYKNFGQNKPSQLSSVPSISYSGNWPAFQKI